MRTSDGSIILGLFLALCIWCSCGEKVEPESFLQVRDLEAFDNGNEGNAADIEIFFDKQFNDSDISIYRLYVVKADKTGEYDLPFLLSLDDSFYETVLTKDIFPIQGKTLSSELTDAEGDLIEEGVPYRVAVVSLPIDEEIWSPSLTLSSESVTLGSNSLVRPHSRDLESGYGDFTMNADGDLFMSSYNIIDDLFGGADEDTPLYSFSNSGRETALINYKGVLGGNAFNSQNLLYQSVIDKGEVLIIDPSGEVSLLPFDENRIEKPDGIFINSDDEVFIVGSKSGVVFKVSVDGSISRYASVGENARGIVGDEEGNIYVSINDEDGRIMKVDKEGIVSRLADVPTFKPDDYNLEYIMWLGYLTYHDGELYVPSVGANQIYKVSLSGQVDLYAGSGRRLFPKGDIKNAHFNRPMSLAFTEDGSTAYVNSCLDVTPLHTQASYPSKVYVIDLVD